MLTGKAATKAAAKASGKVSQKMGLASPASIAPGTKAMTVLPTISPGISPSRSRLGNAVSPSSGCLPNRLCLHPVGVVFADVAGAVGGDFAYEGFGQRLVVGKLDGVASGFVLF